MENGPYQTLSYDNYTASDNKVVIMITNYDNIYYNEASCCSCCCYSNTSDSG